MTTNLTKVYGGPGCGKTTYLLDILDKLLRHTSPSKIAYVSFTNKGTDAGVNRARRKHKLSKKDTPYWSTLHSIANKMACKNSGRIVSKDDYKELSKALGMRFLGYFTEELNHGDDIYLFMEQLNRTNSNKHNEMLNSIPDIQKYHWIIEQYIRYKHIYKVYDFTDMLEFYTLYDRPLDIDYMIIDEAQDLTPLQWAVADMMSLKCKQVFVAGDDDQAIYEWCGGDVGIFNTLPAKEEVVLNKSHRLGSRVLEVSQKLVSNITNRKDKNISPVKQRVGNVYTYTNLYDVPINLTNSYYFLSRNRQYLNSVRDLLMQKGFPFRLRNIHYPRKISGINKSNISDLEYGYTQRMKEKDYVRAINDNNRITVDTIHRVKGGEADEVVLLLDCTKAVQENLISNLEEELRILYVAMTRSKYNLHIVLSGIQNSYDSIMFGLKSFL